jgi:hypothetical protein
MKQEMERNEIKKEGLAGAVESLQIIADGLEEWLEEQRDRFKRTTKIFRKKGY